MLDLRSYSTSILRRWGRKLAPNNPIRRAVSTLWSRLLTASGSNLLVEINGRKWRLKNDYRMMPATYEPETFELWEKLIAPDSHVWDIGANIGLYTLVACAGVSSKGSVKSWEPAPETFQTLQNHVNWNNMAEKCQLIQEAIGNVNSELVFSIEPDSTTNRLGTTKESKRSVKVPVRTLDYWLDQVGPKPSLIKMDIEGAEVLAFQEADRLLREVRPTIVLAVHPQFAPEYGATTSVIVSALKRNQYDCYNGDGKLCEPDQYAEYVLFPVEKRQEAALLFSDSK